jgi:hypothetical protein
VQIQKYKIKQLLDTSLNIFMNCLEEKKKNKFDLMFSSFFFSSLMALVRSPAHNTEYSSSFVCFCVLCFSIETDMLDGIKWQMVRFPTEIFR